MPEQQALRKYRKKGIKLLPKTIGIEKEIAPEVVRGDKHNLSKLQSTKQCNVRREGHRFVRCDLQISQVVFVTSKSFTNDILFYFQ